MSSDHTQGREGKRIQNRLSFDNKVRLLRWCEKHRAEIEATGMSKIEVALRAGKVLGLPDLSASHITGVNETAGIKFPHGGTRLGTMQRIVVEQVLRILRESGGTMTDEFRVVCEREGIIGSG